MKLRWRVAQLSLGSLAIDGGIPNAARKGTGTLQVFSPAALDLDQRCNRPATCPGAHLALGATRFRLAG
jgi:hypothetical protein